MSKLQELAQQALEDGGLSEIITKVRIRTGYRSFTAGVKAADNWHDDDGDTEKRKAIKARLHKANLAAGKEGKKAVPSIACALVCPKAQSFGEHVGKWQADMIFAYELWTDDYTEVLGPSLVKFDLDSGMEAWVRIGQVYSPRGGTRTGDNGKEYKNTVHVILQKFANEAEALAAAQADKAKWEDGASAGAVSTTVYPPTEAGGWTHANWDKQIPNVIKLLRQGFTPEQLAGEDRLTNEPGEKRYGFGVPLECITSLIDAE